MRHSNRSCAAALLGIASLPAIAADCAPTPAMFQGTHYAPVSVQKVDVGKGMVFAGTVRSASGCVHIPGARIAHWQTNSAGYYVDALRAYLHAGTDGGYRFETEWPGAPIPHVHFIVSAPGYRTLTTQWVGEQPIDQVTLDFVLQPE